jgi:DNA polymerase-3 subunit delta
VSSPEPLDPVYLIHGSDREKVDVAVARLRRRFENEDGAVESLLAVPGTGSDAGAASPADVVDACNALSLMGGRRLVLALGADQKWVDAAAPDVAAYVVSPAPETTLAIVAGTLKADGKLARAVAAAGRVLTFDLPEKRQLQPWLRKRATQAGLDIEPEALRRLTELARGDASQLGTEIEKLALYAGGRTVTVADVDTVCVFDVELPPWELTDALANREPALALAVLGDFLDRRDWDVARVLPSLARLFRQLSVARRLVEDGQGPEAIQKALDMRSPYPARKLQGQAGRWSREEISAALVRIARAERETRGDGVLPDRLTLERTTLELVPAADR